MPAALLTRGRKVVDGSGAPGRMTGLAPFAGDVPHPDAGRRHVVDRFLRRPRAARIAGALVRRDNAKRFCGAARPGPAASTGRRR